MVIAINSSRSSLGRASATATATLPLVETFHSIQGEGHWVGASAYFIRLAGCNVGCPWCDTKQSWNDKAHPQHSVEELVQGAIAAAPQFVVITGGEPLMHDLGPLTRSLRAAGLRIHLETSGAYPLTGRFDWITLSPKPTRPPCPEIYAQANELKVVIAQASDLRWAEQQARRVSPQLLKLLQPEWGTPEAKSWIFDYILQHPDWRMSLQIHKYLSIR